MKIAILGGKGMLGSDLVKFLSQDFTVTPITRQNYARYKGKSFDVLINANGNSRRYWALQNIYEDFEASTVSVYKSVLDFKYDKYIYISSVDVYPDPSSPKTTSERSLIDATKQNAYGFHKYLSEQIVRKHANNWMILRPSAILGTNLKKGPIYDIMQGNTVYITRQSKIQFISTKAINDVIHVIIKENKSSEIYNVGGLGVFNFKSVSEIFDIDLINSKEAKKQIYNMDISRIKRLYSQLESSKEYVIQYMNNLQD